jgi:hypothetical protein
MLLRLFCIAEDDLIESVVVAFLALGDNFASKLLALHKEEGTMAKKQGVIF